MSIDVTKLEAPVPASVRLRLFREILAGHTARFIANPMDEEAAFAVRHFQAVVDVLLEEIRDEWPEYITE